MTADIDRQKLRELCERATPGPWVSEGRATGKSPDAGCGVIASNDDLVISNPSRGITAWACRLVGMTNAECEANASFIAAARTTLPTLLDLFDAQAAKIAELEAQPVCPSSCSGDPEPATYPTPAHGWVCFHCGERFAPNLLGQSRARDHFGNQPNATPACRIKDDDERALLMAFRRGELELERCRVDDLFQKNKIASLESECHQLRKQVEGRADWMRKAETDVIAERRRQIEQEGWTPEHDARHAAGDLADAAACYASTDRDLRHGVPFGWPWSAAWWKPTDRRRDLVKAGALIIAEIERLDRAAILSAASALEQKERE